MFFTNSQLCFSKGRRPVGSSGSSSGRRRFVARFGFRSKNFDGTFDFGRIFFKKTNGRIVKGQLLPVKERTKSNGRIKRWCGLSPFWIRLIRIDWKRSIWLDFKVVCVWIEDLTQIPTGTDGSGRGGGVCLDGIQQGWNGWRKKFMPLTKETEVIMVMIDMICMGTNGCSWWSRRDQKWSQHVLRGSRSIAVGRVVSRVDGQWIDESNQRWERFSMNSWRKEERNESANRFWTVNQSNLPFPATIQWLWSRVEHSSVVKVSDSFLVDSWAHPNAWCFFFSNGWCLFMFSHTVIIITSFDTRCF